MAEEQNQLYEPDSLVAAFVDKLQRIVAKAPVEVRAVPAITATPMGGYPPEKKVQRRPTLTLVHG